MLLHLLTLAGSAALACALGYFFLARRFLKRIETLELDLQKFSEAMCQMAEIQMKGYQKLNGNVGEIEERLLELAMPARDSSLTLDRRHKVLALSRKGMAVDEIVKRLNLPRGEAELILNLQKFTDNEGSKDRHSIGESKRYVQA